MKLSEFHDILFDIINDGEFERFRLYESVSEFQTLCFASSHKELEAMIQEPKVSCIICASEFIENEMIQKSVKGIVICDDPQKTFYLLQDKLARTQKESYVRNIYGNDCKIHPTAIIAECGVEMGHNVVMEEFVVIREGVKLGNNVVIRAGAVIGGCGQQIVKLSSGETCKIQHAGSIEIGNDVEIGYYACIESGLLFNEVTKIGNYCCVDTDAVIAHGCHIEDNVMVLAQAQICSNTYIEDHVRINPKAIVDKNLKIENESIVTIGAVVADDVKRGTKVSGNFAIEHEQFLLSHRRKLRN